MRTLTLLSTVAVSATACELMWFTDENCGAASLEVEDKVPGVGGLVTRKKKLSRWIFWAPGACTKFDPVIEHEETKGDEETVKTTAGYTWGISGVGSGQFSYLIMGEDNEECVYDGKKVAEAAAEGNVEFSKTYSANVDAGEGVNVCTPSTNHGGLVTKDSKDGYYSRVTCGPVPAAIAGIVLGTLGIVFSLAGLGLAAAAGK